MKNIVINQLMIIILLLFSCKNELEEPHHIFIKQSKLDKILISLDKNECIKASDAKLLFSDLESDKNYVLFYNSPYYDSSALRKKILMESPLGKKLLAKYDSAKTRLINQKQYFEFPIEFTDSYDVEQKSFFYTIGSQAYTTIDLEYQILKKDTFYYLNEEQAQTIIEEGIEFQKSQARIFKDRYLPRKFIEDVYYSHKHPTLEQFDNGENKKLDFSKILVSRLYKIPVEQSVISDIKNGEIRMAVGFNYTGNIVNDYAEVRNLQIMVFDYKNNIVFSKEY
jgi:hypothetical protein